MKRAKRVIIGTLISSILLTTTAFAKTEPTYNTPNTTTEDTDKKSECEVTADIHYAYYVSIPATITLEPFVNSDYSSDVSSLMSISESISIGYGINLGDSQRVASKYQVKAKLKDNIGNKYIIIYPKTNHTNYWYRQKHPTTMQNIASSSADILGKYICADFDIYRTLSLTGIETNRTLPKGFVAQRKICFGKNTDSHVEKVDNTKWTAIDGYVGFFEKGKYKGEFEFVYGLTDTIPEFEDIQ